MARGSAPNGRAAGVDPHSTTAPPTEPAAAATTAAPEATVSRHVIPPGVDLERLVGLEFVRATESGALSAYKWMGKGDKESGDFAACDAIRGLFDTVCMRGIVTIGEGIKDGAPGIFKGEKLGTWTEGSIKLAIAIDPIDGTTIVSKGLPGAISVIAAATCEEGEDPNTLLADIPSFYMNKISFGPRVRQGPGRVRLDYSVQDNLEIIALKLGKRVQDLTVVILDRPRHERLIHDVRRAGAAIRLISDGDIAAAIAPSLPGSGVDVYMGTGGSPEAVLAAAGIKCLGGEILAQMWPRDEAERKALKEEHKLTDADFAKVYTADDLAKGTGILFAATGISDSALLPGIRYEDTSAITNSILMRAKHQTIRYIRTVHNLDLKTLRLRSDAQDHSL